MSSEQISIPSSLPALAKRTYSLGRFKQMDDKWITRRLGRIGNPALRRIAIDLLYLSRPVLTRGSRDGFRRRVSELLDDPLALPPVESRLGSQLLKSISSSERIMRIVNSLAEVQLSAMVLEECKDLLDALYAQRWDLRMLRPLQGGTRLERVADFLLEHTGLLVDRQRGLTAQQTAILPVLYCTAYIMLVAALNGPNSLASSLMWLPPAIFAVVYAIVRSEYENDKAIALFISFTDEFVAGDEGCGMGDAE
ncbi:hypothetical protein KDL29_13720 [bacterium]|nr:hypothetical protein [bacterium]